MLKGENPASQKNAITSELIKKYLRKFGTTILRPQAMLSKSFIFLSFETFEK